MIKIFCNHCEKEIKIPKNYPSSNFESSEDQFIHFKYMGQHCLCNKCYRLYEKENNQLLYEQQEKTERLRKKWFNPIIR